MEYTVATNWDPMLLDVINYPEVTSVFGGLPNTPLSSGRSSISIKNVKDDEIREYIKNVHARGLKFVYNINTLCTQNKELTQEGYKEIREYLDWLCEMSIDGVTVSVPNLINVVKKHYPHLYLKISTFQKIHTVSMAKHYEDMGADAIMLSDHISRNIKLLRSIRENVKCQLILIANTGCVYDCPNMLSHANSIAHSGLKSENPTLFTESYVAGCTYKRLHKIEEIAKIRWIRPEDVSFYEEIGIDVLKILDRHSSTDALGERVRAYCNRSYDGNLLGLLGQMSNVKKSRKMKYREIYSNSTIDDRKKARLFYQDALQISIPDLYCLHNKKIPDNFIKSFEHRECETTSCDKCGYCKNVIDFALERTADKEEVDEIVNKLAVVREKITDGSILY